ncbi:MAG TPA: hypothetical protein VH619_10100 [Verrucomicrobiae bacterium]|nr:hypothetical protein [Verrucomicrobiae bacterium]
MRKRRSILTSIFPAAGVCAALFLFGIAAHAGDRHMVLEGIDGDVTTNEYRSFINELKYLPPPPTNDIDNLMVDERDGARIHGMQTFYVFTHDRRDLDMAIVWSDAFLHARNDPTNGRIVWTGKRDLCWPNKATNDEAHALYSGAENGDVIEHIVNTARLILENPAVWNETAPTDKYGFGATYLDRAKTYVNECQRSAETTIVPWYVRSTRDGYRLIHPDSRVYYKYCESSGPVPWNQQQAITGGLLRLAQCHRLLNDGNTNIAYYEKITGDAADWFFASALLVSAHNRVCYNWPYAVTLDPTVEPESTVESDYDMFIFRAFEANLGPTRLQMQRLINTARFVMYLGTNRIAGHVNGTSDRPGNRDSYRDFLDFQWIEMSVLDHDLYHKAASVLLTSREYYDKLGVEAAVLSVKHYWAAHSPIPEPEEVLDPAKLPPVSKQTSPLIALIRRHMPPVSRTPAAAMLLLWIVSGLGRIATKRFDSNAAGHDPWSAIITRIYLIIVALGVFAALRLHAAAALWPSGVIPVAVFLLGLGLALQWYAIIQIRNLGKTNAAATPKNRVIPPYYFLWRLSYAGSLLAVIGLSLSFMNWASLLIMCVPACALVLWRIRTVPAGGKGSFVA